VDAINVGYVGPAGRIYSMRALLFVVLAVWAFSHDQDPKET
jgi:hypothetical protein